jgi:hypothetical protein
MDLDIDLVMSFCWGKKTFVITLLRDKESLQREQHPYVAQRPQLSPELPLLDVIEDKVRVTLDRHPRQGQPSPCRGVRLGADKVTDIPYDKGLDDHHVAEQVPADYPPWRHRGTGLLGASCPRAQRNFGGVDDGAQEVRDHG